MSALNDQKNIKLSDKLEVNNTETVKKDVKPAKKFQFSSYPMRLKNIFFPNNPSLSRRILKPSFVLGILLGFSISYYYNSIEVFSFIKILQLTDQFFRVLFCCKKKHYILSSPRVRER